MATKVSAPFTAEQFAPTPHASAEEKARFANHFVRFVRGDFAESLFHQAFYNRLHMMFGHIAHYNRRGFHDHWFANEETRLAFLNHALRWDLNGNPRFTWGDVERALQSWIRASGALDAAHAAFAAEAERRERALLAHLLAKYPDASPLRRQDLPQQIDLLAELTPA